MPNHQQHATHEAVRPHASPRCLIASALNRGEGTKGVFVAGVSRLHLGYYCTEFRHYVAYGFCRNVYSLTNPFHTLCSLVAISFANQHGAITTEESIKKRQSEYQKMVNRLADDKS